MKQNILLIVKVIEPNSFPKILGHDSENYILAMEWFDNKNL